MANPNKVSMLGVESPLSFYAWIFRIKVDKILKGSLDLIQSPSVKIQNHGWESFLEVYRQNIAGLCQQTF